MADPDHIAQLMKGAAAWNAWRRENRDIVPDLSQANLSRAHLSEAYLDEAVLREARRRRADLDEALLREVRGRIPTDAYIRATDATIRWTRLNGVDLTRADLSEANVVEGHLFGADLVGANLSRANLGRACLVHASLVHANLVKANLSGAELNRADLYAANLSGANLSEADLSWTNLTGADLSRTNLTKANLHGATLVGTDFTHADLTASRIFGVSAWGLRLEGANQQNLVITDLGWPEITVDNIEVAQFVYLLLQNEKIRDVIDTIGKKGVLLLGRFTEGRMEVLDRLRQKLRDLGFVPMVFNFDKPETKDFTETVRLLCNLSHFVIVDITNPRSAPLELQATVPDYMVPFAPILQQGEEPFAMFVDLQNKYDWVLRDVIGYPSVDRLIEVLEDEVVKPAEAKFNELLARRTNELRVKNV
jgi:uncharacterized protein YjbI with pentapeptide repeats